MKRSTSLLRLHFPLALALSFASAAPLAVAADAPAVPVKVTAVAYFDFDAARLRDADKPALLADVAKMQNVTWQSVTTVGHTDSVGSRKANARLAARRAAAVKAYLVAKGLDATMIRTAAAAAARPVADNTTSEGRARNRRTEVVFEGVRPGS